MKSRLRHGFSLIELMLALVIGGLVVVMARVLFEQFETSDRQLDQAARTHMERQNSSRFAAQLLDNLEVGTAADRTFSGETDRAEFTSWCAVSAGWMEHCRVALVVDTTRMPAQLLVMTSAGDSVVVRGNVSGSSLRYVTDPEDPAAWVFRWGRGISAPLAIALITPFDTTLFHIGPRG